MNLSEFDIIWFKIKLKSEILSQSDLSSWLWSRLKTFDAGRYPNAAKSTGETDSEEERELQAERERLERLKATREEQDEKMKEKENLTKTSLIFNI